MFEMSASTSKKFETTPKEPLIVSDRELTDSLGKRIQQLS